mmetsp:Transcript_13705/g.34720  ORF Transcript_13705/g.34720 Transcript_13705/m.34720 type:complete len:221 (+) Transcript_13705:1026-1688(+)
MGSAEPSLAVQTPPIHLPARPGKISLMPFSSSISVSKPYLAAKGIQVLNWLYLFSESQSAKFPTFCQPTANPSSSSMPLHRFIDSCINPSSRRSRPCCRQKPHDFEDCEAPTPRVSSTVTLAPLSARWYAVEHPMTPAPTTSTSGRRRDVSKTGVGAGAMLKEAAPRDKPAAAVGTAGAAGAVAALPTRAAARAVLAAGIIWTSSGMLPRRFEPVVSRLM